MRKHILIILLLMSSLSAALPADGAAPSAIRCLGPCPDIDCPPATCADPCPDERCDPSPCPDTGCVGEICADNAACGILMCAEGMDCVPDPCPTGRCGTPPPAPTVPGLSACRDGQETFAFTFWSGSDGHGNRLAAGEPDPIWRVSPGGVAYGKGDTVWGWAPAEGTWINSYPGEGENGAPGEYVYVAHYHVPAGAHEVEVSGWYSSDYSSTYADHGPTRVEWANDYGSTPEYDTQRVTVYPVQEDGLHRIVIHVFNDGIYPNPTGLVTETTVSGRCGHAPLPGAAACDGNVDAFSFPISTGLDANGYPLPPGSPDPRWSVNGLVAWTHDPFSGWVASGQARWIDLSPQQTSQPAGNYWYSMPYILPAEAYDVRITGRFALDNDGLMAQTGTTIVLYLGATEEVTGFDEWTTFDLQVPDTGPHVIEASVRNLGGVTGLIVEGVVTGRCA